MKRRQPAAEAVLGAAVLVTALLGVGCGDAGAPPTDPGPGDAALLLFDLARIAEPTGEELAAVIEPVPAGGKRATLLDELSKLAGVTALHVVEVSQPAGPGDAFVDLEARLPEGGIARFSLRMRGSEPGGWRVAWFQGPGVSWPPGKSRPGESLSSSAPPGTSH